MSLRVTGTETLAELDEAIEHVRGTISTWHTAPEELRDALDDLLDARLDQIEHR